MSHIQPILRHYEVVVLLRPDVTDAGQDTMRGRVRDIVTGAGGVEVRWETWGRRKLAYAIQKQQRAIYSYCSFIAPQTAVAEMERNLRLMESVLRYQTVRLADQVDLAKFDLEGERKKRTPLFLTPEEAAAAEQRGFERDWQTDGQDFDYRGGRGGNDDAIEPEEERS